MSGNHSHSVGNDHDRGLTQDMVYEKSSCIKQQLSKWNLSVLHYLASVFFACFFCISLFRSLFLFCFVFIFCFFFQFIILGVFIASFVFLYNYIYI